MSTVSIVAPAYNEVDVIEQFVARVQESMERLAAAYEIVIVDDGSGDGTFELLQQLHRSDRRVKVVRLSRNFGQEAAVQAGLDHAQGDAVVLTDSDLQDPPELIPKLIEKWSRGAQVVLAERSARSERLSRRLATSLFHWLFRRFSHFDEEGQVGLFCLLDRQVVGVLRKMTERHRYLRGLRSYAGFRRAVVKYERPRRDGDPRQSLAKLIRIAADGLFSFSYVPLRLSLALGLVVSFLCVSYAVVLLVLRLLNYNVVPGFTTQSVAIMFLGGVQLVAMGILGEYLGRIYEEVKRRPGYVVEQTVGLASAGHKTGLPR